MTGNTVSAIKSKRIFTQESDALMKLKTLYARHKEIEKVAGNISNAKSFLGHGHTLTGNKILFLNFEPETQLYDLDEVNIKYSKINNYDESNEIIDSFSSYTTYLTNAFSFNVKKSLSYFFSLLKGGLGLSLSLRNESIPRNNSSKSIISYLEDKMNVLYTIQIDDNDLVKIKHAEDMLFLFNSLLPADLRTTQLDSSRWFGYKFFIQKFGTHVATSVDYGARVRHYYEVSSHDLNVAKNLHASLDLQIPILKRDGGGPKLSSGIKKSAKDSKNVTKSRKLILGGSDDMKSWIAKHSSNSEIVSEFLQSALENPKPIRYRFKSIAFLVENLIRSRNENWDLSSFDLRRIKNLEFLVDYMLLQNDIYKYNN
ncbi:hypothetical protein ROZALSC1DRAFT_31612 [Rozella allomycis CSF55]|uniref:MACPF domain-containing protein n=1 Tax=Rozella allomycis (strain CSF55) TaxID=988480 RepID=A0A4V1IZ13_ROZAC|nr:hypothetical protein ROZALSC1DRAFT_31612 [Rozella allomycis CSF55]